MKINKYKIETRGRGRIPVRVREATCEVNGTAWDNPKAMAQLACRLYRLPYMAEEYVIIIALDAQGIPKCAFEVSHGTSNYAPILPSEVLKRVLLSGADMFVMLHNHPSGNLDPSRDDEKACKRMKEASEIIGVMMIDFIITGRDGGYCSFLNKGIL